MRKHASSTEAPQRETSAATGATAARTALFADRFRGQFVTDFFRCARTRLTLSSVALGTYLGESDDATDALYAAAAHEAVANGINVVDTAINYRCQRSERVIGDVLKQLIHQGIVRRDEIVICTKAGYVPLDGAAPASREEYERYLRREYYEAGILTPADLVGGGHAITPAFLEDQLQRSLRNLGVKTIDYFYIHNPEQQLSAVTPAELATRLRAAFSFLESCASRGTIGAYGCATWSGLRLPAGSHGHLSLYELVGLARDVAGDAHHFHVAQLPVNLSMSEAVRVSTQRDLKGRLVHVTDAAQELGIDLVVSAPLLQGELTRNLPDAVRSVFTGETDAQRALAFARSLPGVVTVAIGMRQAGHLRENLSGLRAA